MDIKGKVLSFGVAFAGEMMSDQDALDMMEGYLMKRLKNFTASDAAYAIENNFPLWGNLPPRLKTALEKLAKQKSVQRQYARFASLVDAKQVMKWFQTSRPDILSVILNYPDGKGVRYLETQVEDLKKQFAEAMKKGAAHAQETGEGKEGSLAQGIIPGHSA